MTTLGKTQNVYALPPSGPELALTHQDASTSARGLKDRDMVLGRFDPTATLIRIPVVISITGIGRATVYKLMSQPESGFPQPVKLTDSNARGAPVAWVLSEVLNWTRARIAARDEAAA